MMHIPMKEFTIILLSSGFVSPALLSLDTCSENDWKGALGSYLTAHVRFDTINPLEWDR
jgi:hypothetical protein